MTHANHGDGPHSETESTRAAEAGEESSAAAGPTEAPMQDNAADDRDQGGNDGAAGSSEVEALQAEVSDLKDKLLRAVAETENLRRRYEREMSDLRKFAASEFARDMLSVADNLQRALAAVPAEAREANEDLARLLEGVELTERDLQSQFEKHGIKTVEAMGAKLDPNLHQAVVQIEDASVEPGTVVHVMQPGYIIHERLLRAAMVGVAKGGAKADAPGASPDEPGQTIDTEA